MIFCHFFYDFWLYTWPNTLNISENIIYWIIAFFWPNMQLFFVSKRLGWMRWYDKMNCSTDDLQIQMKSVFVNHCYANNLATKVFLPKQFLLDIETCWVSIDLTRLYVIFVCEVMSFSLNFCMHNIVL